MFTGEHLEVRPDRDTQCCRQAPLTCGDHVTHSTLGTNYFRCSWPVDELIGALDKGYRTEQFAGLTSQAWR